MLPSGSSQPPRTHSEAHSFVIPQRHVWEAGQQDRLEEQRKAREERKRVANELRNAQKRRRRLKHKGRLLSQDDLAQKPALRKEEEEETNVKKARRGKFQGRAQDSERSRASAEEQHSIGEDLVDGERLACDASLTMPTMPSP